MYSAAPGHSPWLSNAPIHSAGAPPAFIPVSARNTYMNQSGLPPPPPPPQFFQGQTAPMYQTITATPSPVPAARKKTTDWPPDVRDYVSRSFAPESQVVGIAKQDVESKLKQVITEAASSSQLETLNWKALPLPQQLIQMERSHAILAPQMQSYLSQTNPLPVVTGFVRNSPTDTNRKRKSSELKSDMDSSNPPWRTANSGGALEDRVTFAPPSDKRQKLDQGKNHSKSLANLEQRKKRFEGGKTGSDSPRKQQPSHHDTPPPSEPTGPVVGTCEKLEKNYFRLTSAPNPKDVRPLHILRQTLELLKKKWRTESNYTYICDQFKSLRQDLTVQHIKNDFTTNVYEIHARIALEKGDLGEYNQCQTQLRELYKQGLGGHPVEFMAYRILYLIHTCNRTDMNDVLSDLTPADKSEAAVHHALEVRSALALGNYHKFFKLYLTVPNMGGYLMDTFIERERLAALSRICRAYKPDVRLRFITEELAFESDEDTARFLLDHGSDSLLQQTEDHVRLLTGKAGQLFELARQAAFQQVDIKGQI